MRNYKARGIVLHTVKYGDSSLVAFLLTDTLGRQSYMVQGIKSSRGHTNKGALLQPMFVLEFEGYEAPKSTMHRIREMRAAPVLRSVPFDVRKSTMALFMAETLYRLVREVEPDSPLFDFVFGAIAALDAMDSPPAIANFHLWFMVALSRHLGFFPGNEWAPRHWFDIREGLFTPIEPHGAFFSHENAALLGALMDISLDFDPAFNPATDTATDTVAENLKDPKDLVSAEHTDHANSAVRSLTESLVALPLNRTRRVDFLGAMLAYFGYHLDATRDIRSVDILREVF